MVLTSYASSELLNEAIAAGASAYLLKDVSREMLVQAIETARELGEAVGGTG